MNGNRILSVGSLILLQIKTLNQFLLKLICLEKGFFCSCIYKHRHMLITDLNLTYLSPLPENLNKEVKLFFLMGVFSINLMKIDSKLENSQFHNTTC